ncbi:MAG: hypothetical protein CME06_13900 [Gemmatimonadetes bacterium]|nr:hypothetical protein [Gemmatimonadota bacterium]
MVQLSPLRLGGQEKIARRCKYAAGPLHRGGSPRAGGEGEGSSDADDLALEKDVSDSHDQQKPALRIGLFASEPSEPVFQTIDPWA